MFGWLKSNPSKKLQKKIAQRHAQAVQFQRNGKLREYAEVMAEIETLEKELIVAQSDKT